MLEMQQDMMSGPKFLVHLVLKGGPKNPDERHLALPGRPTILALPFRKFSDPLSSVGLWAPVLIPSPKTSGLLMVLYGTCAHPLISSKEPESIQGPATSFKQPKYETSLFRPLYHLCESSLEAAQLSNIRNWQGCLWK